MYQHLFFKTYYDITVKHECTFPGSVIKTNMDITLVRMVDIENK